MKKNIGTYSLIIALVGLASSLIAIYYFNINNVYTILILAAFEAATIGAFADWFAVSALFRRIPIPVIGNHTNIIARNRKRLSNGVIDLITKEWLTPSVILNKISSVNFSSKIIDLLSNENYKNQILIYVSSIIKKLVNELDNEEFAVFLEKILKEQIKDVNISEQLGNWMNTIVRTGNHNEVVETILDAGKQSLNDEETKYIIYEMLQKQLDNYKNESIISSILVGAGEAFEVIDKAAIVNKLIEYLNKTVDEVKHDPYHSLRLKIDNSILEYSNKLMAGDKESVEQLAKFQTRFIENIDSKKLIHSSLSKLKYSINKQLIEDESELKNIISEYYTRALSNFGKNIQLQTNINGWIKKKIGELTVRYHDQIGLLVKESLEALKDEEIVAQIESKVGDDLQYIRLNGAVVGGFIGVMIALLKMAI